MKNKKKMGHIKKKTKQEGRETDLELREKGAPEE